MHYTNRISRCKSCLRVNSLRKGQGHFVHGTPNFYFFPVPKNIFYSFFKSLFETIHRIFEGDILIGDVSTAHAFYDLSNRKLKTCVKSSCMRNSDLVDNLKKSSFLVCTEVLSIVSIHVIYSTYTRFHLFTIYQTILL